MESEYSTVERTEYMRDVSGMKVAENGLGFGEGTISFEARRAEVGPAALVQIEQIIFDGSVLTPVSSDKFGKQIDDDGCGDGRVVTRVFEGSVEKTKSLDRPKVFGGGATMTTASLIGLGEAKDKKLSDVFSESMALLRDKMIGFGAHTDTHASGENCGCGAIDKAPAIIRNAVRFNREIRSTIEALGIPTDGLGDVEAAYASYAAGDMGAYSGKSIMNEIIDNGKIVKELDDDHKEIAVILNQVPGYTVDQEKIRKLSHSNAQAFAVDVWRVVELAERMYADQSDDVKHKALLSELVYTLATAATLTKGDLPVYVIHQQPQALQV